MMMMMMKEMCCHVAFTGRSTLSLQRYIAHGTLHRRSAAGIFIHFHPFYSYNNSHR